MYSDNGISPDEYNPPHNSSIHPMGEDAVPVLVWTTIRDGIFRLTAGPPRHQTTEGAVSVTCFTSRENAERFLGFEYYRDMVQITELSPKEYVEWLRDAVDNYEVTVMFPDPDHVMDIGNYRVIPVVQLLLALEGAL